MTDLHDRFRTLDRLPAPNMWPEIETRAAAHRREPSRTFVVVLAAAAVLALAVIGGALSIAGHGPTRPVPSDGRVPSPSAATTPRHDTVGAWSVTGDLHVARHGHTATLLPNGTVLVAGGFQGSAGLASAEIFDPRTGEWAATGSMLVGRGVHSATLLPDGTVLVVGGVGFAGGPGEDVELASAEVYDPRTGQWTATGSMGEARSGGVVVSLPDGRVLAAGGWGSGAGFGPRLATAEAYDPATGTWAPTGTMTRRRDGPEGSLLPNGLVLVVGGGNGGVRVASAELYDPVTGTWTATGSPPEPFGRPAMFLLNGTVLVAGGDVPTGPGAVGSAHAASYDPATGTWTFVAPMHIPRLALAGVLLPDGRALVTGGRVSGGPRSVTFLSAEAYDPASMTWTLVAEMHVARSGHSVTLLPDGRVLVVGGLGTQSDEALASVELFDPAAGP